MRFRLIAPLPATAGAVILIDQASKLFVLHKLNLDSVGQIAVFPPYLVFRMAWNRGVNFGLLAEHGELARWGLVALALGISLWVFVWVRRARLGVPVQVAAGLLIGGALGNVIDRLSYGAVADFLNMSCCGIQNRYSFNLADVGVFLGAVGLVALTGRKSTGSPGDGESPPRGDSGGGKSP